MFDTSSSAQNAARALTQEQQYKIRFGCVAARIGSDLTHKIPFPIPVEKPIASTVTNGHSARAAQGKRHPYIVEHDTRDHLDPKALSTPSALMMAAPPIPRAAKAGSTVYLAVQDITRFPDEAAKAHWICRHPECRGEKYASKRELLAAHPSNKELTSKQETHLYYAVFEQPEQPARPEKRNGDKVIEPAQPAQPPVVLLLSDEE